MGRLFREFAVTLSASIALSAVVSLTVTPAMCARMLAQTHARRNLAYRASERAFTMMLGAYEWGLDRVLRHRIVTLLATLGAVGLTVHPRG